mgnify:CR=1 FL=1
MERKILGLGKEESCDLSDLLVSAVTGRELV